MVAFKPVVTGLDDEPGEWPPDHELLASVTGQRPEEVSPYRFGLAAAPHLAGDVDPEGLVPPPGEPLVVEGVGGLLVPLAEDFSVRDLCARLGLPLVVAARPGLGTINHTLLTLEAARRAGLEVLAVVLTPWPDQPDVIERSNRETIERLGAVPVHGLPPTTSEGLAEAGSLLPLDAWLRHTPPR